MPKKVGTYLTTKQINLFEYYLGKFSILFFTCQNSSTLCSTNISQALTKAKFFWSAKQITNALAYFCVTEVIFTWHMLLLTLERLLLLLTLVGLKNQALVSALMIILLKLPKHSR